jgi:hypothetical protein
MPEKIYLTYTNATSVPYQGSTLGHHIVINYIDADGVHHTLQGVPGNPIQHNVDKALAFFDEEAFSDGARNTDSPFGPLISPPEHTDRDVSLNQPYTMVAEGDDLSAQWALMRDFADEVNSTGYEYRPVSQNSNSFAGGALQRAGLIGAGSANPERFVHLPAFDPATGETSKRYVPGFETTLKNPINTATPMPFPLDVYTARPSGGGVGPEPPDRRRPLLPTIQISRAACSAG